MIDVFDPYPCIYRFRLVMYDWVFCGQSIQAFGTQGTIVVQVPNGQVAIMIVLSPS
jgi:hypothetical protein